MGSLALAALLQAGTWHAQMGFGLSGFWAFLVYSTGVTLLITWVYLNTTRSILTALLLHFTANFTSQLVVPFSDRVEVILSLLVLAIGLVVCVIAKRGSHMAKSQVRGGRLSTELPAPVGE